jgi:hypothetical protein
VIQTGGTINYNEVDNKSDKAESKSVIQTGGTINYNEVDNNSDKTESKSAKKRKTVQAPIIVCRGRRHSRTTTR